MGISRRQKNRIISSGGELRINMRSPEPAARCSLGTAAAHRINPIQAARGTSRRPNTRHRAAVQRSWNRPGGSFSIRARCDAAVSSAASHWPLRRGSRAGSRSSPAHPSPDSRRRDQGPPNTARASCGRRSPCPGVPVKATAAGAARTRDASSLKFRPASCATPWAKIIEPACAISRKLTAIATP